MDQSNKQDERIAKMKFATIYPLYLAKIEKKGRSADELHQIIEWLTDYNLKKQQELLNDNVTFEVFFKNATINSNAYLITGQICGIRVEDIKNQLTQQLRYLDKLVDELAKGRKMEKILRTPNS